MFAVYAVLFAVYAILFAVYAVLFAVYAILFAVYAVLFAVYAILFAVYAVRVMWFWPWQCTQGEEWHMSRPPKDVISLPFSKRDCGVATGQWAHREVCL